MNNGDDGLMEGKFVSSVKCKRSEDSGQRASSAIIDLYCTIFISSTIEEENPCIQIMKI